MFRLKNVKAIIRQIASIELQIEILTQKSDKELLETITIY